MSSHPQPHCVHHGSSPATDKTFRLAHMNRHAHSDPAISHRWLVIRRRSFSRAPFLTFACADGDTLCDGGTARCYLLPRLFSGRPMAVQRFLLVARTFLVRNTPSLPRPRRLPANHSALTFLILGGSLDSKVKLCCRRFHDASASRTRTCRPSQRAGICFTMFANTRRYLYP